MESELERALKNDRNLGFLESCLGSVSNRERIVNQWILGLGFLAVGLRVLGLRA